MGKPCLLGITVVNLSSTKYPSGLLTETSPELSPDVPSSCSRYRYISDPAPILDWPRRRRTVDTQSVDVVLGDESLDVVVQVGDDGVVLSVDVDEGKLCESQEVS